MASASRLANGASMLTRPRATPKLTGNSTPAIACTSSPVTPANIIVDFPNGGSATVHRSGSNEHVDNAARAARA
jgi:hypothetical protein